MKTNETGRSMVEMLGVLAIIGVLSVAGIAGYTQAMKKNRVNAALADISTCVILAKTTNGGNGITAETSCAALGLTMKSQLDETTTKINVDADGVYYVSNVGVDGSATIAKTDLQDLAPITSATAGKAGFYIP